MRDETQRVTGMPVTPKWPPCWQLRSAPGKPLRCREAGARCVPGGARRGCTRTGVAAAAPSARRLASGRAVARGALRPGRARRSHGGGGSGWGRGGRRFGGDAGTVRCGRPRPAAPLTPAHSEPATPGGSQRSTPTPRADRTQQGPTDTPATGPASSHPGQAQDDTALCRAYRQVQDSGKAADATAFDRLASAAGGASAVPDYCDGLLAAQPSKGNGTSKREKAEPTQAEPEEAEGTGNNSRGNSDAR